VAFAQQKEAAADTVPKVRVLPEIVISASRLSEKQLTAPRNPDRSLPAITFMHPSEKSHIPPDLGAFAKPNK